MWQGANCSLDAHAPLFPKGALRLPDVWSEAKLAISNACSDLRCAVSSAPAPVLSRLTRDGDSSLPLRGIERIAGVQPDAVRSQIDTQESLLAVYHPRVVCAAAEVEGGGGGCNRGAGLSGRVRAIERQAFLASSSAMGSRCDPNPIADGQSTSSSCSSVISQSARIRVSRPGPMVSRA